ncbi:MAG: ParB/RepB/Spo0J family partition protein [Anaerolineae bacterium]|nr:ParB/RepB/Spo0J family partition protein [Anaerolineae bacterium]
MASRKTGLGKGLGALIPMASDASDASDASTAGVLSVPLTAIQPNPHQPRSQIRDQDLVELAASIEAHGIIQPLIVKREGDGYCLIAGERRWRAARLAGLPSVPVVVKDVAPQQMLELALVENVQREDLNPLEKAIAYRQLVDEFGLTHADVAKRVGKSRAAVSNTLRLLDAAEPVQARLMEGMISEGHARALLGFETPDAQTLALKIVVQTSLNVRQTEELVRIVSQLEDDGARVVALKTILSKGLTLPEAESWVHKRLSGQPSAGQQPPPPSPEVQAVENRFRAALGTKVRLAPSKRGGRIIIYYYSDEELDTIYERLAES